jgi:hypothetical protein
LRFRRAGKEALKPVSIAAALFRASSISIADDAARQKLFGRGGQLSRLLHLAREMRPPSEATKRFEQKQESKENSYG